MVAASISVGAGRAQQKTPNPVVLYVDMQVDPAKEKEMVNNYHTIFKPPPSNFQVTST